MINSLPPAKRSSQRGSAMLITMILISALLAGGTVLVSMQLASNRGSDLTRTGISALDCAEAGLVTARPAVAANYGQWPTALAACGAGPYPCAEPQWMSAALGTHDLDGDGQADFVVYIRDNDDEVPTEPRLDSDLSVFVVSRCIKYAETPTEVSELFRLSGGGTCYNSQFGGCGGNSNAN